MQPTLIVAWSKARRRELHCAILDLSWVLHRGHKIVLLVRCMLGGQRIGAWLCELDFRLSLATLLSLAMSFILDSLPIDPGGFLSVLRAEVYLYIIVMIAGH